MTEVAQSQSMKLDPATTSKKTLIRTLDDLWERYLNLLDQYQTLRNHLNQALALGYISLAHANFSAPNRIHYGQDFYDERMQASIRTSMNPKGKFLIRDPGEQGDAISTVETGPEVSSVSENAERDREHLDAKIGATTEAKPDITPPVKATAQDPLKWFGVLIPPALRSAQGHFKNVVLSAVPKLANISRELQALEIEIRRMRKKILRSASMAADDYAGNIS